MTKSKLVTLTLASASFQVTGGNEKELIANAKLAFAKQLSEGVFPHVTYNINESNALSMDAVHAGLIVETNKGDVGIVTATNKKNIHVTYSNGKSVGGVPEAFLKSDKTFEEARYNRSESEKKIQFWFEGYSAFIKNGQDILAVVIGKSTRGKTKLHIVGTTTYLTVPEEQLPKFLKDERSEI